MQSYDFLKSWVKEGAILSADHGKLLIGWGKRTWLNKPAIGKSTPHFYFPDYFLKTSKPWFKHEHFREICVEELLSSLLRFLVDIKHAYEWHNPYKKFFYEAFDALQKKISNGCLAKAVPYIVATTAMPMSDTQLMISLKSSLKYIQQNQAYLYGFWDNNEGVLGATPEILFTYGEEGELVTMACAGTRKKGEDIAAFFSDLKELNEHHLVVKGITESLSPFGTVSVGKLQLVELPQLVHLVTPINVELHEKLLFQEAVNALHPTPALGAFPKNKGKAWLEDYQQKIPRLRFGAPAGYWFSDGKSSKCYVSIRNVQWKGNQMQIAAGCGVVADSICDKEWDEVNVKLNAVQEMLAL